MNNKKEIKSALESLMFIWGEPLKAGDVTGLFGITKAEAIECFKELQNEYECQERGLRIREVNKAFQFVTPEFNSGYIKEMCTPVKLKRLSQSALEVLAIVAYKQPVTRAEIESIRGVKSERTIDGLRDKGLIEEKGRSEAIGRPILFGTTDEFLKKFGFTSLKDLPEIEDLSLDISSAHDDDLIEGQTSFFDNEI
ncbi:MAG: SMC-Scp complex subunit ScpB [Clostridia bacterium]|nr:SMC-Scp complex subunit ScpB [Clostridia bacterium]